MEIAAETARLREQWLCGGGVDIDDADGELPAGYSVSVQYRPHLQSYLLEAVSSGTGDGVESVTLSDWGLRKLDALFRQNKEQRKLDQLPHGLGVDFYEAAFCCCLRYTSLCGGVGEGAGFHAALPQAVFDEIADASAGSVHGGEVFECFASPFNVSLESSGATPSVDVEARHEGRKQKRIKVEDGRGGSTRVPRYHAYCSFFAEDAVFGSCGSFFHLKPVRGFYEVNPVFDVFTIRRVLCHMEDCLRDAASQLQELSPDTQCRADSVAGSSVKGGVGDDNLIFLLVLPDWLQRNGETEASPIDDVLRSPFLRATVTRKPHKHSYIKGRCWDWNKMSVERGPPAGPGVSKSRMSLLAARPVDGDEAFLARLANRWKQ